jgi:hypothetical protein
LTDYKATGERTVVAVPVTLPRQPVVKLAALEMHDEAAAGESEDEVAETVAETGESVRVIEEEESPVVVRDQDEEVANMVVAP